VGTVLGPRGVWNILSPNDGTVHVDDATCGCCDELCSSQVTLFRTAFAMRLQRRPLLLLACAIAAGLLWFAQQGNAALRKTALVEQLYMGGPTSRDYSSFNGLDMFGPTVHEVSFSTVCACVVRMPTQCLQRFSNDLARELSIA
jgi:hypothetical protein